jgi:hypothetical protein
MKESECHDVSMKQGLIGRLGMSKIIILVVSL